jgi:ribosome-associated protein
MTAKEKAELVVAACEEHKALETAMLPLRDTIVADYFVIAAGRSRVQVQALADAVEERLDQAGVALGHREGYDAARWVLLDYGDVVVHVFAEEERRFYGLERLWEETEAAREDA